MLSSSLTLSLQAVQTFGLQVVCQLVLGFLWTKCTTRHPFMCGAAKWSFLMLQGNKSDSATHAQQWLPPWKVCHDGDKN